MSKAQGLESRKTESAILPSARIFQTHYEPITAMSRHDWYNGKQGPQAFFVYASIKGRVAPMAGKAFSRLTEHSDGPTRGLVCNELSPQSDEAGIIISICS